MNDAQWEKLLAVLDGRTDVPPVGFIIDSPWLPNWHGITIREYLTSEKLWMEANLRAMETFPECLFFPGFWAEFGMCTEPSAFGARCVFPPDEFPFPEKSFRTIEAADDLPEPDPENDGLLPFVLERMHRAQPRMEEGGWKFRFSVSRGPLNIASFLMGTTEFLTALKIDPDRTHELLRKITRFLVRWHEIQRRRFPSIDGILVLDDIVGFLGSEDYLQFAHPYLSEVFAPDVRVKFFHNDAACRQTVAHYRDAGIRLYNPGIQSTLTEIRKLSEGTLVLLGNLPPRDVLAAGSPDDVRRAVRSLFEEIGGDRSGLIVSCAGGMPPGVPTENIRALIDEVYAAGRKKGL